MYAYFHADPMVRKGEVTCADPRLRSCGWPDGDAFLERTQVLHWLAWDLFPAGSRAHLELGPDEALAWSGDPSFLASFQAEASSGDLEAAASQVREDLRRWLDEGHSLGLHTHGQMPDGQGAWGSADPEPGGPDACEATASQPVNDLEPGLLEEVVWETAAAGDSLLQALGRDVAFSTFTGAIPRSLEHKRLTVTGPDALDPDTSRSFPASFLPVSAGPADSECFTQVADHPPFTVFPQDDHLALASGEGPPVIPGVASLGRMDERFGAYADSTPPAALRRLLQLLLNWRYDALQGRPTRPWIFTWGNHLFDLYEGTPGSHDPLARDTLPEVGNAFRADAEELLSAVVGLAGQTSWHGVQAPDGVLRWVGPEELAAAPPDLEPFSYVSPEGEPLPDLDLSAYPYLPLPARLLARTHLACTGWLGDAEVFVFQRCEAGWDWGMSETGGYACLDGASPTWTYLAVADSDDCVPAPISPSPLLSAAIDEPDLGPASGCPGGLDVPVQGLLFEAQDGGAVQVPGCP